MSDQRIEVLFYNLEDDDSRWVEAEVYVDGSIVFEVRDNYTLANTARAIMKEFGERTRVLVRWEYHPEWQEREARYWDSGHGAGREAVLMTPTDRLC